ncbi:hypothetical protein HYH03_015937 [Edaphochlamys debaryana]|uniref:Uncharacterized protein n=1 Tax=Edaphochlamys debaryana TaxID=47281 RepID=A0A835XK70_9CHLO|nr:hypothetical protein HYH03_015937 [Edaphochlamys debaryana]|eukprot:KAG2485356.1 hypothetical protein HYH03_015937 [Edaphochlamys debaryana]
MPPPSAGAATCGWLAAGLGAAAAWGPDIPARARAALDTGKAVQTFRSRAKGRYCLVDFDNCKAALLSEGGSPGRAALGSWLTDLKEVFTGEQTLAALVRRLGSRRFRLRLVCEAYMRPVAEGYAVDRPDASSFCARLLPALQVSYALLQSYNLAAAVARFVFPMLPVVPEDLMQGAQALLASLRRVKTGSLDDFACIKVGVALRQLRAFLAEADRSAQWGGLSMVELEGGRPPLWVCAECIAGGGGGGGGGGCCGAAPNGASAAGEANGRHHHRSAAVTGATGGEAGPGAGAGVSGAGAEAAGALVRRLGSRRFRLRLVCEAYMRPVAEGYAVDRPDASSFCARLLPALQVSYALLQSYNLAAAVARFVFPMLPVVPEDLMQGAQALLASLRRVKTGSLDDFACIKVGVALRQLRAFLAEADRSAQWGGLSMAAGAAAGAGAAAARLLTGPRLRGRRTGGTTTEALRSPGPPEGRQGRGRGAGVSGAGAEAAGALVRRLGSRRFRLRLVCEAYMRPVAEGYAVDRPDASSFCARLLPALQVSYALLQSYNLAAAVARFVFPMLPVVPEDLMQGAQALLASLRRVKTGSLDDFACIKVGVALRQLRAFLAEADRSAQWGGLSMVELEGGRPPLWVCAECIAGGGGGGGGGGCCGAAPNGASAAGEANGRHHHRSAAVTGATGGEAGPGAGAGVSGAGAEAAGGKEVAGGGGGGVRGGKESPLVGGGRAASASDLHRHHHHHHDHDHGGSGKKGGFGAHHKKGAVAPLPPPSSSSSSSSSGSDDEGEGASGAEGGGVAVGCFGGSGRGGGRGSQGGSSKQAARGRRQGQGRQRRGEGGQAPLGQGGAGGGRGPGP